MLYFPRKRSITLYFSFTSFQLRTENFEAVLPAYAVRLIHCFGAFLLFLPFCEGDLSGEEYIRARAIVASFFDALPIVSLVLCLIQNAHQFLDSFLLPPFGGTLLLPNILLSYNFWT